MIVKRSTVIQAHLILASFLLSIAAVFLVTGGLYTLDVKGTVDKKVFEITLNNTFPHDLDKLEALVIKELSSRQLTLPSGDVYLKKKKGKYELRWSDLKYAVKLKQAKTNHQATLIYRERSLLTQLMRIHRAEAGDGFIVLSMFLVFGMLLIFITGVYLAYNIPRHRKPMFIGALLGMTILFGQVLLNT